MLEEDATRTDEAEGKEHYLTVRVAPELRRRFVERCAELGDSPSSAISSLMAHYTVAGRKEAALSRDAAPR